MAYSVQDLRNLEAAIASGERAVEYDGKKVEFRSIAELMRAKQVVSDSLIAAGLYAPATFSNRGPATLATFSRD